MRTNNKGKSFLARLSMTLTLAVLTTVSAWAQESIEGLTYNTAGGYYEINDAQDLVDLANYVNNRKSTSGMTFKQTAPISFNSDFFPIGYYYSTGYYPRFSGIYDGGGYTISGLKINTRISNWVGLFGCVNGGTVKNVCLVSPSITGDNCGSVAGFVYEGTIENCWVYNPILNGGSKGAIVGRSDHWTNNLKNLYFYDSDTSHNYSAVASIAGGSDRITNVTRARRVTLQDDVSVIPVATDMDYGFSYNSENYYRVDTKLTLTYTGTSTPIGYLPIFTANGNALSGDTYTVNNTDGDVTLGTTFIPDYTNFEASGTNEYTIHTVKGWNLFCDFIEGGESFSGKTVKLGADIEVSRMAGSNNKSFSGTFDGQDHTLTLNYGTADNPVDAQFVAPFVMTLRNTTPIFRNLTIDGHIYEAYTGSEAHNVGGLIGHLYGDVTIEHCKSNVNIISTGGASGFVGLCEHSVSFNDCLSSVVIHSADGNNSGFVSWSRASGWNINFTGCLFNGKLLQKDNSGSSNSGFIGWTGSNKTVSITNCLVAPTALSDGETMASSNSATFARGWNATTTATNSYYVTALGSAQSKQAHSITASESVTLAFSGTATEYSVSGITAYPAGIQYNNVYYAGNGDVVGLTLGTVGYEYSEGYSANAGTLSGNDTDGYTLTMPDNDVTVSNRLNLIDWATVNAGTVADPYMIYNKDQFALLANRISGIGETLQEDGFSGKHFKLCADIDCTAIVGTSDHRFKGFFDGGGYTLNVDYTATADGCAPFLYIEGATISSLKVTGTISTGYKYAAGIVAHSYGDSNIKNCWSSVDITSSISGDGTHAGLVAVEYDGILNITDCLFDGSITGSSTTNCGGFVGWRNGVLNITNCLMAGTLGISLDNNSATFSRNNVTPVNSYYRTAYGAVQGTAVGNMTNEELVTALGSAWQVIDNSVVPILDGKNIGTAIVSSIKKYYMWQNGDPIAITYTVTTLDGTPLTKGSDYTETFSASPVQNEGTYTLTISGIGSYSGSQTFTFTVCNGITVTSDITEWEDGNTYNVTSDVTITERINVMGDVTLHLGEGATLYATKGITVVGGDGNGQKVDGKPNGNANSLTIEGTGTLNADMSQGGKVNSGNQPNAAAIGGGLYLDQEHDYRSWCGNITINGGTVYALSSKSAGIGCSAVYSHVTNSGGTITINGGNVTAISKANYSSGIGGSYFSEAGTININGGKVVAEAYGENPDVPYYNRPATAIGNSGTGKNTHGGGTINITGGQITATTGKHGIGYMDIQGIAPLNVNLSWTNATDYINVKSINASSLTFIKPFVAEGEDYTEQSAAAFANKKMVPADHIVTFDAGESSSTYNPLGVIDGKAISAPATDPVPTDATLTFKGWMNGSTPYDFTAAVTSDLTLTAAYGHDLIISGLKHLYNYNNGSVIDLGYSVVNASNQTVLTSSTDYVVTISDGTNTNLSAVTAKGIYTLTVTGQGTFAGIEKTYEFAVDNAVSLGDYEFVNLGEDIYGISTAGLLEDLAAYANGGGNTWAKTFKLMRDIALDTSQANNHSPISNYFNGTFDGQGFTVSGIRINTDNGKNLGLFGVISANATITRVKVSDAVIVGMSEIGGIVGYNYHGTITDCVADASVKILASKDNANTIGGIAGCNYGLVKGCVSAFTISRNGHANIAAGGIVGNNWGTVTDCIYTGSYVKSDYIKFGYLVGIEREDATISNSYHTGKDHDINGIHTNYDDDTSYTDYYHGYPFTINADEYVTSLAFSGTPTEYATSGITTYDDSQGILFGNQHYATYNDKLRLLLTAERTGHIFNGYKIVWSRGSMNMMDAGNGVWTFEMPGDDVIITPKWANYLAGDVNGDGVIDISDVVAMVNYILGNSSNSFIFANADLDENGEIDISDVVAIVNLILNGTGN